MPILEGKVAVITGGSSGIGLATAARFVEEGAYVYIVGRREAELDRAVESIGQNVAAARADVSSLEDLDRLYARIAAEKGTLDVVFANAGIFDIGTFPEITPEQFDRTFDINVRGVFFAVQKALPLMTKGGSIVLTASIGGSTARAAGYSIYGASKAAVRSFARTWTVDLKGRGIRVNAISPGPIDTPIIDVRAPDKQAADQLRVNYAKSIPMGRMGRTEDVAAAALFLASAQSSFITGIELFVDGGVAQV